MTFEEFAADRLPGVLRFAAVLTGDRALAQDLAQEVLIRAHSRWRKIGSLDRPEYYVRKMILDEFLSWRPRCEPACSRPSTLLAVTSCAHLHRADR